MNGFFKKLTEGLDPTGSLKADSQSLLMKYGREVTAIHTLNVAAEARTIAQRYGLDEYKAETAGLLHDISAVVPDSSKLSICEMLGIEILAGERAFPMLLHQRLSAVMAQDMFSINDKGILEAIDCHTTLKANASPMDMVLFIADKLQWDQKDRPPFFDEIRKGLEKSLHQAAFAYVSYQWENMDKLMVLHPRLAEAYEWLKVMVAEDS